jgi:dehydrogenase/reductase SDR family protein 7B
MNSPEVLLLLLLLFSWNLSAAYLPRIGEPLIRDNLLVVRSLSAAGPLFSRESEASRCYRYRCHPGTNHLAVNGRAAPNCLRKASTICSMSHINDETQRALQGKTVLLTGASGGLGRSLALQFSRCGVKTLILSARKKQAIESVAHECTQVNPAVTIHILTCDLASPESVSKLGQEALQLSRTIDVLVNNGGVSSRSRFLDTTHEVDRQIMQINFLSGAALAKLVVPPMVSKRHGRIIWISSVQGLVGIPNRSSYAASKFAVQGYCESIRAELATSGISVHCASPGYIRTNLSQSAMTGTGAAYGKTDATTASGADPDDVAVTILNKAVRGDADFVVAATLPAKAAVWMRLLCPGLLRSSLVKRYEKSEKEKVE